MRRLIPIFLGLLVTGPLGASDIANGQQIYRKHCAGCHGLRGVAGMAGAADFARGEGLLQSDFDLLARIKGGKNACPAYLGILKEQQIFDVIAYIRTLSQ